MNDVFDLWDLPAASEVALIAGWHQWADAGNVSSGLPQYLIDTLEARKIGVIQPEGFYLFQMPGTHHFFRPEIKLRKATSSRSRSAKTSSTTGAMATKGW